MRPKIGEIKEMKREFQNSLLHESGPPNNRAIILFITYITVRNTS